METQQTNELVDGRISSNYKRPHHRSMIFLGLWRYDELPRHSYYPSNFIMIMVESMESGEPDGGAKVMDVQTVALHLLCIPIIFGRIEPG